MNDEQHPLQITTPEEFDAALKSDRLLIHIDVNWAMQARQSRPVVRQFHAAIMNNPRFARLPLFTIDCSEQDGTLWDHLANWFSSQSMDQRLMYGGNGAVVWIKDGGVVDSLDSAAGYGLKILLARTHAAFGDE